MERYQKKAIIRDLKKKMVFLSGPRQSGKTTLAKEISKEFSSFIYLNFDNFEDRKIINQMSWHSNVELLIFDEIHKMAQWKNYLKGVFDTRAEHQKILVTGSARLEIFTQVGDSLAGRYFLHRLLPLSPSECYQTNTAFSIDQFLQRGSFPEPFFAETLIDANRWRLQYTDSLLREDVLQFDNIQNLKDIGLVFQMLRHRVGSPISYSSIAEDVGISPNTVKKYIAILEALYIVFRVTPHSHNIARSLLKEPKIYFFDTGLVQGDEGVCFENLVATCLLKHVYGKVDYEAEKYCLNYLRTKEGKEVDFAICCEQKVEKIIEVKNSDFKASENLIYFHEKYQIPALQVVKNLKREQLQNSIEILSGLNFLKNLYL